MKREEEGEELYDVVIEGKWNEKMDGGDCLEERLWKMEEIMGEYKEEIGRVGEGFKDFVRGEKEGMGRLVSQLKGEG